MANKNRTWSLYLLFLLCFSTKGMGQAAVVIRMDTRGVYQIIDNFAASDAWSCQFIGNWPEAKKNVIADWLFSMDTLEDGSPKGIGLSLWRCNIGAGSAEQGDSSGIRDEWRRAPERSAGQLWFLEAAKQRGVRQFLGFVNSPPVSLTRNGRAFSGTAGKSNIAPERYDAFAGYLVRVIKDIKKAVGVDLDYLSPVNEPQWDWSDGGQEGCPYLNEEIYGVVKSLSGALKAGGLNTRIVVPESGHLKYLLADGDKPGRGNQVNAFFLSSSPLYMGGLYNVCKVVAGHSYFSTSPSQSGVELRKELQKAVEGGGLRYWESEYCILGDNAGEINGSRRDTGMDAALYLARVIHNDLVYGQATAWQWWLAISPYNYKDGLIYVDKNKQDGSFHDSKKLWALGNFCRWVRPGMQRIEVSGGGDSLFVSAYKGMGQRVVVLINSSRMDRKIAMEGSFSMYTTSDTENLQKHVVRRGEPIVLQARSINTLVVQRF